MNLNPMSKPLTVDHLHDAISKADSLADLRRMVGPSPAELVANAKRMTNMDALLQRAKANKWPDCFDLWPYPNNVKYRRMFEDQKQFENTYC